ncbi:conserved protein of unknown function [Candidatus Filomicrobium marinum]|uniref:Uncharacterized protein n=2 Tax=Candidatus Filomicrobium marinum TaxID=1608628 RepID=A0A0D6JKB8_9HYPH|nr:conserved protein of unknown function [Candidatus Filomicrobium marinum]CPR22403.1 conserved protein of unknown function [Candidatus Filomicrobium marinum]
MFPIAAPCFPRRKNPLYLCIFMLSFVFLKQVENIISARAQACLYPKALVALALIISAQPVAANDGNTPTRHYETWVGADTAKNVWLLYSGTTASPFGHIYEDGLRLRFVGGYGQYTYGGKRPELNPAYTGFGAEPWLITPYKTFKARVQFAEALIGYQLRTGELTTKAFVGISAIDHDIRPGDYAILPDANGKPQKYSFNFASGLDVGVKIALELWLNLGADAYASLDLAWSDAHLTRSARARIGHYLFDGLSAGLEANFNLDRNGEVRLKDEEFVTDAPIDYARFGVFARYNWDGGEISASAGLLGDFTQNQSAYGTVNWVTQF